MPVDTNLNKEGMIYQREQYAKGGLGVRYWDYRDSSAFNYIKGNDILDAGCGEGITLEKLVNRFPQGKIVGIDTEAENIDICRQHNLPVQSGSVYDIPFADKSFDTVLFSEVIEHLDHPEQALSEIARVLRPGGRVIVIFPNDFMFMVARLLTGMIREAFYDPGHVMQWTPKKFAAAVTAAGLTLHSARSLPFFFWPICLHHIAVAKRVD